MKMNDADYFVWVAEHLHSITYGVHFSAVTYVDDEGYFRTYQYKYDENNITDIGSIDDSELLRRIIDKIIESESSK